jgi:hypothetical protein
MIGALVAAQCKVEEQALFSVMRRLTLHGAKAVWRRLQSGLLTIGVFANFGDVLGLLSAYIEEKPPTITETVRAEHDHAPRVFY